MIDEFQECKACSNIFSIKKKQCPNCHLSTEENRRCPNCHNIWDGIECYHCGMDIGFDTNWD